MPNAFVRGEGRRPHWRRARADLVGTVELNYEHVLSFVLTLYTIVFYIFI